MAIRIVNLFEMVKVHHQYAKGHILSFSPGGLTPKFRKK